MNKRKVFFSFKKFVTEVGKTGAGLHGPMPQYRYISHTSRIYNMFESFPVFR